MSQSTRLTAVLVFLLLALPALPQSRGVRQGPGTGDPYENLVPWRFLEKGGAFVNAPLVLYWLPASAQETETSPLLTSRELVQATDRCISFAVVLPSDTAMIEKFGETGKLPAVVLADGKGNVLRRVENSRGRLTAPPIEKMIR